MLLSETLRLFLDGIARGEEYEYYLKQFQSDRGACFAVLSPDTASDILFRPTLCSPRAECRYRRRRCRCVRSGGETRAFIRSHAERYSRRLGAHR